MVWLFAIFSVFILSAISLIGIFIIAVREERLKKISLYIISFAVGGLFGDVFIHILPESFKSSGASLKISLLVIGGVLLFFILEKFLRWRHCHIPVSKQHQHPVVFMNLIGDGMHNLIDGLLIGASFLVNIPIGISTTLAIVFHEIPQEIGDFGMLVHGGLSSRRALIYNFISSLAAVAGVIISLIAGARIEGYALFLLPLTAGSFLYIAGSDLIPELHHETRISTSLAQLLSIMLGVALMAALAIII